MTTVHKLKNNKCLVLQKNYNKATTVVHREIQFLSRLSYKQNKFTVTNKVISPIKYIA